MWSGIATVANLRRTQQPAASGPGPWQGHTGQPCQGSAPLCPERMLRSRFRSPRVQTQQDRRTSRLQRDKPRLHSDTPELWCGDVPRQAFKRRCHLIQLISTCTDRKILTPSIRARDLTAASAKERAEEWVASISRVPGTTAAADTYIGESAGAAVAAADRAKARHLICSAGYGLIDATTNIAGYSATFASPHADEVTGTPQQASARRHWWQVLRRGVPIGAPTLSALGHEGPIVVAASPVYLDAMHDELLAGLDSGAKIIVVTSGTLRGPLEEVHVPVKGRLRRTLGGSMMAINVRVAARIMEELSEHRLSVENSRALVSDLTAAAPELEKFERRAMSDDEVIDFITGHLLEDRSISHSRLLRLLRDSGSACEQRRFRSLYSLASSALPTEK